MTALVKQRHFQTPESWFAGRFAVYAIQCLAEGFKWHHDNRTIAVVMFQQAAKCGCLSAAFGVVDNIKRIQAWKNYCNEMGVKE